MTDPDFTLLLAGVAPMLIDDIEMPARLRDIDPDYVALLASSLEQQGLQQAIVVRLVGNRHVLVAGAHRLAAARSLGWTHIAISMRELNDEEARLVEIDENLCRRELNALDQAFFLFERKAVYERLNPETKQGGDRKSIKRQSLPFDLALNPQRFTKDAAERVGLSERAVRLALQIASSLDPEAVSYLRGTSFADNQNALLKLSTETPARQRTLARQVRDGKAKTLDAARVAAGFQEPSTDDPQARHYAALLDAWSKADAETRARFVKDIEFTGYVLHQKSAARGKGSAK